VPSAHILLLLLLVWLVYQLCLWWQQLQWLQQLLPLLAQLHLL
jgi:hypothetical protein